MALSNSGLFLYGYTVTTSNNLLDFVAVNAGPTITASIQTGYYSLTAYMQAITSAMNAADSNNTYTISANRTLSAGIQNRITVATSGSFLSLLAHSGVNAASGPWSTMGFSTSSDFTGSTSYTGSSTTGTAFQSVYIPYSFLSPTDIQIPIATTNMSTSGNKETLVYSIQTYWQLQAKYVSTTERNTNWAPFLQWAMQGRLIEFTPDVTAPSTFYNGWLEGAAGSSNGLGYMLKEMLPEYPNNYDTGTLKFRVSPT